ncbi:MAG TPA: type II secretion system protein [Nitrospiria bacterium]|jgi:type II secretory pathway pseudopilin PulG|nr:type II secretion system protein [Nitrospiria bacterium]
MRFKGEQGLGIVDTLIVVVLISIFIGVLLPKYQRVAQEARETAMQMSLGNLRKAIQVYQLTRQKIPADLKVLVQERFIFPIKEGTIFTDQYLKTNALDEAGYPVDPFGHRFGYDPANGRVYSTTKGYERW